MTALHKAGIVGIAVYIVSRMVKKPPSVEMSLALAILAGSMIVFLD